MEIIHELGLSVRAMLYFLERMFGKNNEVYVHLRLHRRWVNKEGLEERVYHDCRVNGLVVDKTRRGYMVWLPLIHEYREFQPGEVLPQNKETVL